MSKLARALAIGGAVVAAAALVVTSGLTRPAPLQQATPNPETDCPWFTTPPVVASGKPYVWGSGIYPCVTQYTDRSYKFTRVPVAYQGYSLLQTANDDQASGPTFTLQFDIDRSCIVYVAIDNRITTPPRWIGGDYVFGSFTASADSWNLTGDTIASPAGTFTVYQRIFPAGHVTLGGNADGVTTDITSVSMYNVLLGPGL